MRAVGQVHRRVLLGTQLLVKVLLEVAWAPGRELEEQPRLQPLSDEPEKQEGGGVAEAEAILGQEEQDGGSWGSSCLVQ